VAQLGARFHGMEEVDGSNPSRSTKPQNLILRDPERVRRQDFTFRKAMSGFSIDLCVETSAGLSDASVGTTS